MDEQLTHHLEAILKESVVTSASVGGGCIANSQLVKTSSGKHYFLKSGCQPGLFQNEANGLLELQKANCIRVPKVLHVEENFLLLEAIETGSKKADFWQSFGEKMARLHQYTNSYFGFYENNFIGATPQLNKATSEEKEDWTSFYFNKRLLFQYKLAEKNGYTTPEFSRAFEKIEKSIESILAGSEEPASLLHGDLWSGNYLVDHLGEPVIIDPAVYYGHREADLAMTRLFGGYPEVFYEAYNVAFPLQHGHEYRLNIYLLYHVMNHLNLFGSGYFQQALSFMKYYG
jgi:fructosamine-3-kinase